ncbi:MAG TPA: hypothetical protein VGL65_00240 [Gemmatimonadales bacterium]|jgi:hypothetical protein
MSERSRSRFWGTVITLGLTGMSLLFLFAVVDDSRAIDNPAPEMAGIAAAVIFFALLKGPVGKSIGRMLDDAGAADEQSAARIDQLEDRVAELAMDQQRVAELEERLDFAERLLSQRESMGSLPKSEH